MFENKAMVAIYNTHREVESAIKELQRSGFDIKKLPIGWNRSTAGFTRVRIWIGLEDMT